MNRHLLRAYARQRDFGYRLAERRRRVCINTLLALYISILLSLILAALWAWKGGV